MTDESPCTTEATPLPLLVMKGSPVRVRASASLSQAGLIAERPVAGASFHLWELDA
jgi:hypothetical protein